MSCCSFFHLCVFAALMRASHPCGTLPAECVSWPGVRRGAGLPSGPSRGRRHSHPGWTVLRFVNSQYFCGLNFSSFILSMVLSPGPNWVATLNVGKGGAHASYYHRANKQVVTIVPHNPQGSADSLSWSCRSRWGLSLKPALGHRRPQPPLDTRWSFQRPT